MAVKGIVEIGIDDSAFLEFQKLFDKYQAQVKDMPGQWADIAAKTSGVKITMSDLTDEAKKQNKALKEQEGIHKYIKILSAGSISTWSGISQEVGKIGSGIGKATASLIKWSTLTAAVSGLAGAGSLFGIDRLAASISASRRSAMGLGINYGQQAAFNANYDRLINAGSLLNGVSQAKYNYTSPAYTALLSAGVSSKSIQTGNTAEISSELLNKLPQLFAGMNTAKDRGMIGAKAHAYGLDQVMSMQDIIAFLNATPEERKNIADRAAQDARTMDLTSEAQRKWQDFTTQMGRASGQIESSIMEKFARLEPGLEKLSDAFVGAVKTFADSDLLKQWIDGIASGLDSFASYIGSKEFSEDVSHLSDFIGKAARAIWDFVTSFNKTLGLSSPSPSSSNDGTTNDGTDTVINSRIRNQNRGTTPVASSNVTSPAVAAMMASGNFPDTQSGHEAFIRAYAQKNGIDPNVATTVAMSEGLRGYNPNVPDQGGDEHSSFGDFQLHMGGISRSMPNSGLGDTAARQGIDPRSHKDWMKADAFALDYASKHGWGSWMGAQAHGINGFYGITKKPSIRIHSNTGSNPVISNSLVANPSTAVSP